MRNAFIKCLTEQARIDERIFVITPDLGFSVLEPFAEEFPERFLNVGIAEQNAIGIAAGLALSGKIVYVYGIIPFLTMRCFEQIRVDVAYMNTNVRIVGVGAGFSYGPAGATHHALEDIAIMRALPNMTVCCPGDAVEVRELIRQSFTYDGPMYFRLGKNGEPVIHPESTAVRIGEAIEVLPGEDATLITTSNMLSLGRQWIDEWHKEGKAVSLVSMATIKPLDKEFICKRIERKKPIITLEEHNIIGGLGSSIAELIAESGTGILFKRVGIPDSYSHYVGSQQFLLKKFNIARPEID